MKAAKYDPDASIGRIVLPYGETGVGKTVSIFASAPLPLAYLAGEPRPYRMSARAAERKELIEDETWFPFEYTTWSELLDFIFTNDFTKYATVALDGLSHIMIGDLAETIAEKSFEAQLQDLEGSTVAADIKNKAIKELKSIINRNKLSLEGYGAISPEMSRLFKGLGLIAQQGKLVIITAKLQEYPKWDRTASAAPSLKGQEFAKHFAGFCDLIGLVEERFEVSKDKNGNPIQGDKPRKVFPPKISFECPADQTFIHKFTGVRPKKGGAPVELVRIPLDFKRIMDEF